MLGRILLTFLLATALAPAQRGSRTGNAGNPNRNDPFGNPNRGMNNPRGGNNQQREVRMKSRFEDLATRLNLDKDQKKEVRSIFDKASKEAEPLRQQMQKCHHDIYEAVKAGKGEEELNQMVEKQSAIYAQMAALETRTFARMYKELDPGQQKHAEEIMPRLSGFFSTKKWASAE